METELFVNVQNFNGEKFQIVALENDNMDTLKLLIFAQNQIAVSGCDFCHNGQVITNATQTLKELNVQNGDVLSIQKRNKVVMNLNSETDSSIEISYFSDEQNDDSLPAQIGLNNNKAFSFAPTLKRQEFCGY